MSLRPRRDVSAASDKAACRLQSVLGVGHNFQSAQQARSTSAAPAGGPGGGLVGPGGNGLARAEITTPDVRRRLLAQLVLEERGGGGRGDEAKPRRPWETVAAEKETIFVSSMEHLGGKYNGQIKDGVPNGFGTLKWTEDGKEREYKGAWHDGASSGDGTLTSRSDAWGAHVTMEAEGAFGKNFQPVDVKVTYENFLGTGSVFEKLELSSVTATSYLYGATTGEKRMWFKADFKAYHNFASIQSQLFGVTTNGVHGAQIEWWGKSLDDFGTSLMNEKSNAVLSGKVAFRPSAQALHDESLDDSWFIGKIEIKNGKARWLSEVRRHVSDARKFSSATAIGDAAETWKADAFDMEGMTDQRTSKEIQRKIERREERERFKFFWGPALFTLGMIMMGVIDGRRQEMRERRERRERFEALG